MPFGERGTTLIKLSTSAQHPSLGTGLALATLLPYDRPVEELAEIAAELQSAQADTADGGGQFGAWAVREHHGTPCVAFCRFIANALYRPGYFLDAALHEITRVLRVDRRAFPGLPERSAWEIIALRSGLRGESDAP